MKQIKDPILYGTVPSFRSRQLCVELAKRVDGVVGIDDRLVVVDAKEKRFGRASITPLNRRPGCSARSDISPDGSG
jgi:hypothetical protein